MRFHIFNRVPSGKHSSIRQLACMFEVQEARSERKKMFNKKNTLDTKLHSAFIRKHDCRTLQQSINNASQ